MVGGGGGAVTDEKKPFRVRKLTYKEDRELDGMEAVILQAEAEAAAMEERLADPDFQREHFLELDRLAGEASAARVAVAALYARWEQLEEIRAGRAG